MATFETKLGCGDIDGDGDKDLMIGAGKPSGDMIHLYLKIRALRKNYG